MNIPETCAVTACLRISRCKLSHQASLLKRERTARLDSNLTQLKNSQEVRVNHILPRMRAALEVSDFCV